MSLSYHPIISDFNKIHFLNYIKKHEAYQSLRSFFSRNWNSRRSNDRLISNSVRFMFHRKCDSNSQISEYQSTSISLRHDSKLNLKKFTKCRTNEWKLGEPFLWSTELSTTRKWWENSNHPTFKLSSSQSFFYTFRAVKESVIWLLYYIQD